MIGSFLRSGVPFRPVSFSSLAMLLLLPVFLSACAVAPGTGRTIFTGGLTEEDEIRIGREQHPQLVASYAGVGLPDRSGVYDNKTLTEYVSTVGHRLVRNSEMAHLDFTFTVLDSPIVNAFALPGGYVYVTRGLLALARDEGELAGVLAHEIGHVTARHSTERHGDSLLAGGGTLLAGVLLGDLGAQAGLTVGEIALSSYSRSQESEADTLGLRYLTRAGYSPKAMAGFLSQLEAETKLQAKISGDPQAAERFSIFQTHPRTADRVRDAEAKAGLIPVTDPIYNRRVYLNWIDGLIYGENPAHGLVDGRQFFQPSLNFTFKVPLGYELVKLSKRVGAKGADGAVVLFAAAPETFNGPMTVYLRDIWAQQRVDELESKTINGFQAASGWVASASGSDQRYFHATAIRGPEGKIYRFLASIPARLAHLYADDFERIAGSFRSLSASEARAVKAKRIALHEVKKGESAGEIAAQLPFDSYKLERFFVLNGFETSNEIVAGEVVKIVVEE